MLTLKGIADITQKQANKNFRGKYPECIITSKLFVVRTSCCQGLEYVDQVHGNRQKQLRCTIFPGRPANQTRLLEAQ